MAHVSSKRILFINIDKPPAKVADYIENYTDNLITRLNLDKAAYRIIDIENNQCCSESLIQSASCVVIGALWPLELEQHLKDRLFSVMRKLDKRGVPLLVLGTAEPILLEAIGCESKLFASNLGLVQIQRVNLQEIMALPMIQRWGWRVSSHQMVNLTVPTKVMNRTCLGEPILIRHSDFLYSSPAALGITHSEMACWAHCFPQYLKWNEAVIELTNNDDWGLCWISDFLHMWGRSQAKIVH